MKWIKKGLIYNPKNMVPSWATGYSALPVANLLNDEIARIYFSVRDNKGRSIPTFIDVDAENPGNIIYHHNEPILKLGETGTFDDNGIMPSSIVDINGLKYLYYIGWNPQQTVSYRLSIGLALSLDGGKSFHKHSNGPILDRAIDEPFFNTAPYVIKENNIWKMWYVSCTIGRNHFITSNMQFLIMESTGKEPKLLALIMMILLTLLVSHTSLKKIIYIR